MDQAALILNMQRRRPAPAVRVWDSMKAELIESPYLVRDEGGWIYYATPEDFKNGDFAMCIPMYTTGKYDSHQAPIWEGDLLQDGEGKGWFVYYHADFERWEVLHLSTGEKMALYKFLRTYPRNAVIGNVFQGRLKN